MPPIDTQAGISSEACGLSFGLRLHLYASSSGEHAWAET